MESWPIPDDAIEAIVTAYWYRYYCHTHCTLCGNSGILETTDTYTPDGVNIGKKHYCICPNGQAMRLEGWHLD